MLRLAGRIALAALLPVSIAEAQGRSLFWKSLTVEARLEAGGALHVSERHHMVFNGDWNGGERTFRIAGQRPELISVTRVDPRTKESHPLSPSSTPAMGVDEFAWSGLSLRWRARRPTDPPFRNSDAIYVIAYRLYDVVFVDGDGYRLDHDFAFAERPGVIQRYSLGLDFDPVWRPAPGLTFPLERTNLPPGETVTLNAPLEWAGQGRPRHLGREGPRAATTTTFTLTAPATPDPTVSSVEKLAALALFVVLTGLLTYWFVRREEASGAYGPWPQVTMAWLEEHIFRHRAEVIGAAWDGDTGHAEAAALIAILAAEGKVENIPGTPPRLKLLVPRDGLVEYERAFVERLFVKGDEIDPVTLRRHYAATGFDPAGAIRAPLEKAAKRLVGTRSSAAAGFGFVGALVIVLLGLPLAGILLLGGDPMQMYRADRMFTPSVGDPMLPFVAGGLAFTPSIILVGLYRSKRKGKLLGALIPVPLILLAVWLTDYLKDLTALEVFLPLTLLLLAMEFLAARSVGSAEDQENLRALLAAREFFKRRLGQPEADVDERWVPYLLAFGLGGELDRWSVTAPRREPTPDPAWPTRTDRTRVDAGLEPVSSGAAAPSFRAGGGAFGGAGASGSWASSISSFASVVATPAPPRDSRSSSSSFGSRSSGSRSGGSSGGSRSGGGGGGGW